MAESVGMPIPLSPLPASLRGAVFSAEEAQAVGVTRARLRAGDLRSVMRGLWARRDRELTEREIVAALCRRDPAVFAMGLTAARILGFPLPGVLDRQVVAPPRQRRPTADRSGRGARASGHGSRGRGRGSRGAVVDRRIHLGTAGSRGKNTALLRWSLADAEVITLRGAPAVRTTTRLRTFLDLAGILERDALVAIGDHLVRRPREAFENRSRPYATIDELRAVAAQFRGRGARRLREAVDLVRMSSDSAAETRLRLAMVRAGLPEPLANAPAREVREDGTIVPLGEPDLQWEQWKVVLEHEGPTHREPEQVMKDIGRGESRRGAGWAEVRTTYKDLRSDCRDAVTRVRRELERRGWTPT